MFAPLLVGSALAGAATVGGLVQHYRRQLGPMTLAEVRALRGLAPTPIALAREGLVKLVGTIGCEAPLRSVHDESLVAVREVHHYTFDGTVRLLTRVERSAAAFWVEDDSGRVDLDPVAARIDFETDGSEGESTLEELRLRLGERVAVLGTVRRDPLTAFHPMRHAQSRADRGLRFVAPPLVTWRTEPEVYPQLRPPAGAAALSVSSVALAVLGAVLQV
jgi:hypothetical protein